MFSQSPSIFAAAITLLPVLLAGVSAAAPQNSDDDWLVQTERWREQRERQLRSPEGWLAVTGLHWLKDGQIRFGSASDCDIRLSPDSAPPCAGTLTLGNGLVLFAATANTSLTFNGKPASKGILGLDSTAPEADSPDRLTVGSTTLQLLRRTSQLAIRIRDSNSPRIRDFQGERWYPPNPSYRVNARFTAAAPGSSIQFQNVRGATLNEALAGTVEFELEGQTFQLQATSDQPGKLFLVFRDQTSGQQTWPGGRFLSIDLPADKSPLILDFNRAYNPPCAYNPHTLCPLPPKQNSLPIAINSGALRPHNPPAGDQSAPR
jgi:uncharacterized protein (DUF1684 family)